MEMEMMGQTPPMSINEQVIAPCFLTAASGLFVVPLISMRLFAEENRTGPSSCWPLHPSATSRSFSANGWPPCCSTAAHPLRQHLLRLSLPVWEPDWKPLRGLSRGPAAGSRRCWRSEPSFPPPPRIKSSPAPPTFGVAFAGIVLVSSYDSVDLAQVLSYLSVTTHFDTFDRGVLCPKTQSIISASFSSDFLDGPLDGISSLEGVTGWQASG